MTLGGGPTVLHTHSLKVFTCENVSQSHDQGAYRA